ncbi:MAG: DUF2911 domain-containing protein [Cyclobacteriaceae bacterium]
MKIRNTIILLLVVFASSKVSAQDVTGTTRMSQKATISQRIGTTDIEIIYSSPLARGRKIFGNIVPYDFTVDGKEYPWRAGSNQNTVIKFSHPVLIEGKKLDSGSYGLHVFVTENEWTFIFSNNSTSWGSFQYDKTDDALRVTKVVKDMEYQDWLSYNFKERKAESVMVELAWERKRSAFKIEVDVASNILSDILAKEEKTAGDYLTLASRTLDQDSAQLSTALEWVEKSIELNEGFQNRAFKGFLLNKTGRKKEAENLINTVLDSAKGFDIYYYSLSRYMLAGEKKEAFKALNDFHKKNPNDWIVHLTFGEYYIKEGNQEKVVEHFQKAYENAPDNWKNYARYLYLSNKIILEP